MRSAYRRNLMGRPSVVSDRCAVCGRRASNRHHVVQKGMGGVSREAERSIPKVSLCGMGNASGCHGLVHQKLLHLQWSDGLGGWCYWVSDLPMDDESAWTMHWRDYRPLPGWTEMRYEEDVIGHG